MSIESILELMPPVWGVTIAEMTIAAGDVIGAGTDLAAVGAGDIIQYTDDLGVIRQGQIESIAGLVITLETPAQGTATAAVLSKATGSVTGQMPCPVFESNNAVNKAGIYHNANPILSGMILRDPQNRTMFDANEGFELISVYVRLPYQYTFADGQLSIRLGLFDALNVFLDNPLSLGSNGALYIPIENIEIPVHAYIPPPAAGVNYKLVPLLSSEIANIGVSVLDSFESASISCIGAPASLNGAVLPINIGFRVKHAIALV